MNLIILTETDRIGESRFRLADHRSIHIREVLRAGVGDRVEVGMLNGPAGTASITAMTPEHVEMEVTAWGEMPGPGYDVDIVCAIPRPKTLKKVLTLAGMMGVRAVHFVRANRTDKSYVASPFLQEPERIPYLLDGLSQGKFTRMPEISVNPLFRPFVEDQLPLLYPPGDQFRKLLCDGSAGLNYGQLDFSTPSISTVIFVGPEGGLVPFEKDLLESIGFLPISLGPWTLRVEAAIPVALAQLDLVYRSRRL